MRTPNGYPGGDGSLDVMPAQVWDDPANPDFGDQVHAVPVVSEFGDGAVPVGVESTVPSGTADQPSLVAAVALKTVSSSRTRQAAPVRTRTSATAMKPSATHPTVPRRSP